MNTQQNMNTQTNMTEWSSIKAQRAHLEEVMDFCPSTSAKKDVVLRTFDRKVLFPYISGLVGETIEMSPIRDTNADLSSRDTNADIRRPTKQREVRKRRPYCDNRRKFKVTQRELWAALNIIGIITPDVISRARECDVDIKINRNRLGKDILNNINKPKFKDAVAKIQHNMQQRTTREERSMIKDQLWRTIKYSKKPMTWNAEINNVLAQGLNYDDVIIMRPPTPDSGSDIWALRIKKK